MKVSAKTDYACRALFELALHWPKEEPLPVSEIARRQKIPLRFLPHILLDLKQKGLVESVRGQRGGYVLARSPQEIKLSEVLGNPMNIDKKPLSFRKKTNDLFAGIWQEIDAAMLDFLEKKDFEEICNQYRQKQEILTYTI